MDPTSLASALNPLRGLYQPVLERISWRLDDSKTSRTHAKAFRDLVVEVERVWQAGQAIIQTCEYNEQLLRDCDMIEPNTAAAIEKCARATVEVMQALHTHLVENKPDDEESRSLFRRLSSTFKMTEEGRAIIAFGALLEEHAVGLNICLCCLNLWLDVQQKASTRVMGYSLAALDQYIMELTRIPKTDLKFKQNSSETPQTESPWKTILLDSATPIVSNRALADLSAAAFAFTKPKVEDPRWRTHVFHESYFGDPKRVIAALKLGVNPDTKGPGGFTLLHTTAELNHIDTARVLIQLGANANVVAQGQLPVLLATLKGHVEVVKLLLDSGVDVNCISPDPANTVLFAACSTGNLELVRYFVLEKNADLSIPNINGDTPLSKAVAMGHATIVEFLLNRGAPQVANNDEVFPIHMAAYLDRKEALTVLLKHGADPNTLSGRNRTPILLAAAAGHTDVIDTLVQHGADVNVPDTHGQTPLYMAVYQGQTKSVRQLLELGADLSIVTEDNISPFHLAAAQGQAEIVKILLDYGADISLPGVHGVTPLIDACSGNHFDVVKILLHSGAELNSRDSAGWTAAAKAATNGHLDILTALTEKGADLAIPDNNGFTPLHKAASCGHSAIVFYLVQRPGADIHFRSTNGLTAIYAAAAEGHAETLGILLDAGGNHSDTYQGMSPLHIAAQEGYVDVVETLLRKGADTLAVNGEGATPAEWARKFGSEEIATHIGDIMA